MKYKIVLGLVVLTAIVLNLVPFEARRDVEDELAVAQEYLPFPWKMILEATAEGDALLIWYGIGGETVHHYNIYRKLLGERDYHLLEQVDAAGDNRGEYRVRDTTVEPGIEYIYGIRSADAHGQEGDMLSDSIVIP